MFERISLMLAGLNREEGQGATEYAMVIGFLVVVTIGLGVLGVGIDNFLDRVAAELDTLVP
jgi:Flp pilus assembly pilin Flp